MFYLFYYGIDLFNSLLFFLHIAMDFTYGAHSKLRG